jgi:hypothetical protein
MQATIETNVDPTSLNVPFTPVIDLNSGEIITNAWDFITYVYGYDNDMTNFRIDYALYHGYPRYAILCDYNLKSLESWVITESWCDYETAIKFALEKAWELVNNQGSCRYGIWETVAELKDTLTQYENEGDEFLTPIRLRLQQLETKVEKLSQTP